MEPDSRDAAAAQLFGLARDGLYCELIWRVNSLQSPSPEMSALRVYGLLRCGDMEPAFVRLAQLVAQVPRDAAVAGALQRWAIASQSHRMSLADLIGEVEDFYRHWNHNIYWKAVARAVRGRELDFIAAAVADVDSIWRILVGVGDALKIREEMFYAFEIYSSMCRVRSNPALLSNVYSTALIACPELVFPILQEFST